MATSISNYDLFSIVENLINEEEVPDNSEQEAKDFEKKVEKIGAKAPKQKKQSKNKLKSKKEEEEPDLIDKDSEDKEEVETPDESPTTLKLADALSYDKFVDDLNKFRSAHSFEDREVSSKLKDYYEKLESDEKKVFYVILQGLIQVTLMKVDGKVALTPSDMMFSIKKTGSVSSEKKRSSRRRKEIAKQLSDQGIEDKKVDTNTPIQTVKIGDVSDGVVIRQDKSKIYEVLRKNV